MSRIVKDKNKPLTNPKRQPQQHKTTPSPPPPPPTTVNMQPKAQQIEADLEKEKQQQLLSSPFADDRNFTLSESDLRDSAYEILLAGCRSSGTRPLTYISHSEKADSGAGRGGGGGDSSSTAPSLQRSLTSVAASKIKKALGMKRSGGGGGGGGGRKAATLGELVRVQMRVSEQSEWRVRRALLRVAAGQLGRRAESVVLPLELLQQLKHSDFPNQQEYESWQRRNLKLLEAGLVLYPHLPLDKSSSFPRRLQQIIRGALEKPIETGTNSESMQNLRSVVMSLASRTLDGLVSESCHWADGFPLNLRLYETLLDACFDVNDEATVIEEVDEVLELIKKTWGILGINQMLHNICFLWVLFQHYVKSGEVEDDLLFASGNVLLEVEKDAKATTDSEYSKILSSVLSSILRWAEKKLLAYRDSFHPDNIESMQSVVSLAVVSAKILVEDISHEYRKKRREVDVAVDRVDTYIRSSLRTAFVQKVRKINKSKQQTGDQRNSLPILANLASDITELAFSEKAVFSPVLKTWHPHAAGVAVATLHSCYGNELKQFVTSISELTPDVLQVLNAADKLEKDLVQIAVEDAVDSEDGGKSIIREMPPYEAESVIANLVKSWVKTRVDRLKEWVGRNLQQEVWDSRANKERIAPSAVEALRLVDETLEAFFLLPINMHQTLLPDLVAGLDKCTQNFILKAKSGCGNRSTFIPTMPALTRCEMGTKFHVLKKKEKSHMNHRIKSQVGTTNGDNSFGIPQLCIRINTLHHIRMQLEALEKRMVTQLVSSKYSHGDDFEGKRFESSTTSCVEGIKQLSEAIAYKIVFLDLSPVLWDGLYVGEVSASRIDPFVQEIEQYLVIISSTIHDRVRTRVITDMMKASFDGFLLVLLAGGPSRAFALHDCEIIEEDFKFLTELFWSNGDGLPADLIDKFSAGVEGVLSLFHTDTESLIDRFKNVTVESYGSAKARFPLPPTSGQWSPSEPNTLLRVLCYRRDETATKFLKKTYNLPKKL